MKNLIPDNVSEHTNVYDVLLERGLIEQSTNPEALRELLGKEKIKFYIGFDPTADCLHVGHFMQVIIMMYMQKYGHTPVVLIGGGTTMLGDPSGRTDARPMMTAEQIDANCMEFKKLFDRFLEFDEDWKHIQGQGVLGKGGENKQPEPGKAICVNNADWLLDLNYVELLREVGTCFSVNNMLRAECYKQRMEKGLSFLEFNYMIMQSYDFYALYQKYGCNMQFGGDDQWSNMLGGTELIRRKLGKDAYAMTINLLLNSEGKKMGKTQKGAVWLDANKTTPFEFYQYWRNVDDADVIKCLKMLTFLPLDQIEEMAKWEGSQLNKAKEILAFELTKMIHGEDEANKAQEGARALFGGGANTDNMPTTEIGEDDLGDDGIAILDLLIKCKLIPSKGEGKRLIQQGGISVDDNKITDMFHKVTKGDFEKGHVIIKKGKKVFHKVTFQA